MIGAKSPPTSNPPPFLNSSGLIVSVCAAPSTSVWPSAGARAASAMPMLPLAPLRLSTTKDWPSTACRRSAMARATMSVAPPGGKGTISRTGRVGEAGCVWPIAGRLAAAWVPAARARAFSALRRDVWLGMFIIESPSCVASVHPCATVDVERMACHVPGAAGTQVMGCICHLGRKPEAAQRDPRRELAPALLRDHGALDRARPHSVDAPAVPGQFNGQCLHQRQHPGFRCAVVRLGPAARCGERGVAGARGARRDQHHRPTAAAKQRNGRLRDQETAREVDLQEPLPFGCIDLIEGLGLCGDRCRMHQGRKRALRRRSLYERGAPRPAGGIGLGEGDALGQGGRWGLGVDMGVDEGRALGGWRLWRLQIGDQHPVVGAEALHAGPADVAGPSGDDGDGLHGHAQSSEAAMWLAAGSMARSMTVGRLALRAAAMASSSASALSTRTPMQPMPRAICAKSIGEKSTAMRRPFMLSRTMPRPWLLATTTVIGRCSCTQVASMLSVIAAQPSPLTQMMLRSG